MRLEVARLVLWPTSPGMPGNDIAPEMLSLGGGAACTGDAVNVAPRAARASEATATSSRGRVTADMGNLLGSPTPSSLPR